MARRVHVDSIHSGEMILPDNQAHHLRDVLRLKTGDIVELFDTQGLVAQGTIAQCDSAKLSVSIGEIHLPGTMTQIIVASAVPKGDRADWMIEKLSELGVTRFFPLKTARSVVHPEGTGKLDRWQRIAVEAAKQCKRAGVMEIGELTSLADRLARSGCVPGACRLFLSTLSDSLQISEFVRTTARPAIVELFIGPEGGWTDDEISQFQSAGLTGVSLTTTILRIETAAILAAGVIACSFGRENRSP